MGNRKVLFFDRFEGEQLLFSQVRRDLEPMFAARDLTPFTVLEGVDVAIETLESEPDASWFILTHYGSGEVTSGFHPGQFRPGVHLINWVRSKQLDASIVLVAKQEDGLSEKEAKISGADAFGLDGIRDQFTSFLDKSARAA